MSKDSARKNVTWNDLMAFGAAKEDWSAEDFAEGTLLANAMDPSTIPEGIEIPDLRPREMIEAEDGGGQSKKI